MPRKRSISSIFDEESESTSSRLPTSRLRRSAYSFINEETEEEVLNQQSSAQPYNKVICNCSKCNGKLVDLRTKISHDQDSEDDSEEPTSDAESRLLPSFGDTSAESQQMEESQETEESETELPEYDDDDTISVSTDNDEARFTFQSRQRLRRYKNRPINIAELEDPAAIEPSEYTTEEDKGTNTDNSQDENEQFGNECHEIFEDYSCPNFEPFQDSKPTQSINDSRFLWILLWIMNFRTRFNLPGTATESLIKFLKLVLTEIGGTDFDGFPDSIYKAKNILGLKEQFHSFAVCPKCHKLYNKQEVKKFSQNDNLSVMRCHHVEFPNSTARRLKLCQTPLSQKMILLNDKVKIQPELIFPLASIKQQLEAMYCRPNFERYLRHWVNRSSFSNILTDIYDGQVWQTFKESTNENSANFFRPDVADTHLGLIINLDWFQPYKGTIYSTGVLYAAICNLPRDIRFKRENLLILGLLPGPNEVSLHKINHYLAPIVNELESLWGGMTLSETYESQEGKKIRAALILVSCDVPAARKICGHVSALVACHRCEKKANYENRQHNFAGINEMDEWFISRDSAEHHQNALGWRRCNSDAARKRFVKQTGVRWSELLRLPYFNPIQFITIDPMHCLFLGIAKWIVKRIWVDEGVLTPDILKTVQKKMNEFKVPSDLDRIPGKVDCGDGFSNFTADQWRIFFTIYATVSLWDHLPVKDRKILTHFVRICSILVSRIVEIDSMREAHQRLIKIIKLIEENYGCDKITPNLHLSLHLCECAYDYGPLYSFWCFSFKRMNGILGSLPNSHRKIESELMRRLMFDSRINNIISSEVVTKGLDLLNNRPSVGSLSEADEFSSEEMRRFLLNSRNIQESAITGNEPFPGEMLDPKSDNVLLSSNMLDLMVEYYMATYEMLEFRKPFGKGSKDSIIISVNMNKFGRCRIGSEIFGSSTSSRHVKSSFVLAKFVTENGDTDCYPGQIQYFFTHIVNLPGEISEHSLAFIRWYKPASSANIRYNFSVDDNDETIKTCNVELWSTEFYPESRDCIIPIHHILSRFVPVTYRISDRRNVRDYLAVNPVNRKYHIR